MGDKKQSATLVVDTREPLHGAWEPYFEARTIRGTLKTGDYSVAGLETEIAIERKELSDLLGCLTTNRGRFERELTRARDMRYFAVICEGTYKQLFEGLYRSRMNKKAAWESVAAFEIRYNIPFYFMGSPELAARKAESLLLKYWREFHEKPLDELSRAINNIFI